LLLWFLFLVLVRGFEVEYPSVVPHPQSIVRKYKYTVKIDPEKLQLKVVVGNGLPAPQPVKDVLQRSLQRMQAGFAMGIQMGHTLPYLRVRLPPLQNTSNPADGFPPLSDTILRDVTVHLKNDQQAIRAQDLPDLPEAYELEIANQPGSDSAVADISSDNWVGALRAFESLSQLVVYDGIQLVLPNLPISITDFPRFHHRGILLDTARHFFPVEDIFSVLEGMAYAKLNLLHWHVVDAQAFPLQLKSLPNMSAAGALAPSLVYSPKDVSSVVQFALDRGIRVVPEIDLPGHTASWGFAPDLHNLTTPCWKTVQASSHGVLERAINVVSLDVTLNKTADVVFSLVDEVVDMFPDPLLHLGGDEVDQACWSEIPRISAFARAHNISNLQAWFTRKVLDHIGTRKQVVLWEEAFGAGTVDGRPEVVINIWKSLQDLPNITKANHSVVLSYGGYMDRQSPLGDTVPPQWMFVSTWADMYTSAYPSSLPEAVRGGEITSFDENADKVNIQNRLFQRGNALAERFWSSPEINNTREARVRLAEFRCKELRRGLKIGPVYPDYCDVHQVAQTPTHTNPAPNAALGWQVATASLGVGWLVTAVCFFRRTSAKFGYKGELQPILNE